MTMTTYTTGYGKREQFPQCAPAPQRVECPCCHGNQEHPFGQGLDADAATCSVCNGFGYLDVSIPSGTQEPTPQPPVHQNIKR